MPQRIVTIWSCSLCPEETDSSDKIKHYQLSEGKRVLVLDVCTNCEATEPFATIVSAALNEKFGGRVPAAKPANGGVVYDGYVTCRFCDEEFSPGGLGLHQSKAHGVKSKTELKLERLGKSGAFVCQCGFRAAAAQGLGAHKRYCPVALGSATEEVEEVTGHPCPDCPGFVAGSAQGLGAHRRHIHPGERKLGHGHSKKVAS